MSEIEIYIEALEDAICVALQYIEDGDAYSAFRELVEMKDIIENRNKKPA